MNMKPYGHGLGSYVCSLLFFGLSFINSCHSSVYVSIGKRVDFPFEIPHLNCNHLFDDCMRKEYHFALSVYCLFYCHVESTHEILVPMVFNLNESELNYIAF